MSISFQEAAKKAVMKGTITKSLKLIKAPKEKDWGWPSFAVVGRIVTISRQSTSAVTCGGRGWV
jgi:hypothetical protein